MRMPATHFAGNLMWTRSGAVYGTWVLEPLSQGNSDEDLRVVADCHRALFRSWAGLEVLIRGSLVWDDPVAVVARMIKGIDLHQHPAWADECEATITSLADLPMGSRRWSVVVPLNAGLLQRLRSAGRAASGSILDAVHWPSPPPSTEEVERYLRAGESLASSWPAMFNHRPATVAEQIWTIRNAQGRGAEAWADPELGDFSDEIWETKGPAAAGEPTLDPGGMSDLDHPNRHRATAPLQRRWLKVMTDTGATNYQAGLVLADTPPGGMESPGSEFLGRIDDAQAPIDIAIRMRVRSRHDAMRRNKRGFAQLTDQVDQVEDSQAMASLSANLQESARLLVEYNQKLAVDTKEVEVEPVVMVSTAAPSGQEVNKSARAFQQARTNKDFTWARPPGAEEDIFWGMLPGGAMTARMWDYRQITTGGDFAQAAPLMTRQLGSSTGLLLGENTTSPLRSPVHVDPIAEARANRPASAAFAGNLGAGKTYAMMRVVGDLIDREVRRGVALDGSKTREWASLARSLTDAEIVDVERPEVSMDPLQVMPIEKAGPVLQSFLTKLCDFAATSTEGQTLAKAVRPTYLSEHRIRTSAQLLAHLDSGCTLPQAKAIADRIGVFADPDTAGSLAEVVFGENLRPMRMNAGLLVIGYHGVEVPTKEELASAHRYQRLSVDKLFGQAFFLLATKYAYDICFDSSDEPTVFAVDETWRITLSDEGAAILLQFLRDGRKNVAATVLGSHDTELDFGGETLSSLIGFKFVMRQGSDDLARKAIRWLGFDPDERKDLVEAALALSPADPHTDQTPPDRRGEALLLDSKRRFGHMRVLPAASEKRRAALDLAPRAKTPRKG